VVKWLCSKVMYYMHHHHQQQGTESHLMSTSNPASRNPDRGIAVDDTVAIISG